VWHPPRSDPPRRSVVARRLVAGLGLAVLAAACVRPDAPGVAIGLFDADLIFGFSEPATVAPPPNTPVPISPPPVNPVPPIPPSGSTLEFPDRDVDDNPFADLPPVNAPADTCPEAAREAFPEEIAGLQVTAAPTEGLSRWKQAGTREVPDIGPLAITGFERRTVQDVEVIREANGAPVELTYATSQLDFFSGAVVVSRFRVITDGVTRTADSRTEIVGVDRVAVREPDAGVALESLEFLDSETGDLIASSTFTPPVLYLPLPVIPGESYQATGVDLRTGATLRHEARVVDRQRVDACGDVVDGWFVEATQVFAGGPDPAPRQYDYVVSTQFGGVLTSERIVTDGVAQGLPSVDVTFSLGQLTPDPLPDSDPAQAGG